MATKQVSLVHVDEDYIDMELSSSSNFFSYSVGSPPQTREFEFQMNLVSNQKESTTSPADELFYKGKLLPLHLPPRLQMVQKLLHNANATFEYAKSESALEDTSFPFTTTDLGLPSTNASTPLESCNISLSESGRVSSEVNPDEYLFEWSNEIDGFVDGLHLPKKSWSKKLKQIKQFWLGQRFKASRAYLKSLFTKSGCSDKSCASAASNVGAEKTSKCKKCQNKNVKVAGKNNNPFEIFDDYKHQRSCAVMKNINRDMLEDGFNNHRRSFSGVIQRHCATKTSSLSTSSSGSSSSSSSFSFSSAGFYDLQLFKRSINENFELEGSIEGAIAHCKQSQQQCSSNKIPDDDRICTKFASRIAVCGNQEMAALGRNRG